MPGKSDTFETALLNLLFKNIAIANIGDAAGLQPSAAAGNLFLSLHTADPGDAATQTTSEVAYTGYARKSVARGAGFNVAGNVASTAADQDFGECTAAPGSPATFYGIGTAANGAGTLLYSGQLMDATFTTPQPIAIAIGTIPRLKAGTRVTED